MHEFRERWEPGEVPVLDLHLDLCRHEKVRDFPDRGRLVMHGSDIHVVTTAVVLGAVATVLS